MDTVFIKGIHAKTTIGVYEHERNIRQALIIDLELGCDTSKAGDTDDFREALDYDAISRFTLNFVQDTRFYLIEAVAEKLCEGLFAEFSIEKINVSITKPGAVAIADAVGVHVVRHRPKR